MKHAALVYIEPGTSYYSRWLIKGKTRTHRFTSSTPLTDYWIEVLRANPDQLDKDATE